MITKELWAKLIYYNWFPDAIDYLLLVIGSIITIPLDILLSPLEIIAFILYKIFEREE